jgi:hypothetical protein
VKALGGLLSRRRTVVAVVALTLALSGLAAPIAHADVWANIGPGSSLAGLKGGWSLGSYELDEHFTAISASVFSGVDVSGLLPMIAFFFANIIWLGTAWLANLLIELFGFAFSLDLVNGSATTGGAGALGPVSRAIQTIYATAFGGPWMVLAVSVAALWAMWKALVERRYAETASQLGLSLIYVCVAFLFVLEPGQTIGTASHWTNQMSGAFLSIAKDGEPSTQADAKEAGANQMFGLLVAQPWAVLEFGGLEHCVKTGTADEEEPESVAVQPLPSSAARSLESGPTVTAGGKTCINDLKKYGPHFLRMPPGSKEREEEFEALSEGDSSKLPDADPGKKSGSYELGPIDTPAAASMEKGGQYQRLLVAVVIFVAEFGAFCLLGALSLGIVVAQVLLLLLLAFSPVALVAAVVPGRGHQFFKAWLAKLAGYLLRKAAYSLILAILLAVCAAISLATSELGWLFSFGLQCAFFWAVFLQRKTLTDGLVGVVAGPGAPRRDRALSLLALYAGARMGNRVLVRPVERVGRRARRGVGRAGAAFRGHGGDRGGEGVAPISVAGVRKSVDLGGRSRSRGEHDEGHQGRRRRSPERRPGDSSDHRRPPRTESGTRSDGGHRDGRGEVESPSAGHSPEERPRRRRGGRGGWRRSSGRRRGRAVSPPQTAARSEATSTGTSRASTGGPTPRPRPKVDGRASSIAAPPPQAPRADKGADLADELRGDLQRKGDDDAARRPAPESGPEKAPRPDARSGRRDRKGRGR